VLGHSQASQRHARTCSWWLVHLAVHQSSLRLALQVDHFRGNHFVVQIVTLARSLTDASEHGVTTMRLGNVVNQLHNDDSLTYSGTTKET
jgi:hypothetical protein